MTVAARSNKIGASRIYTDPVIESYVTYFRDPDIAPLKGQTLSTVVNHYCSRSGKTVGKYITVPNTSTRIRHSTDYTRVVYDVSRPLGWEVTQFAATAAYRRERILCDTTTTNDFVSISHGTLSGWTVNPETEGFNAARTKALLKLQDQKVQLGVDLAEAKKTFNMVAGLASQLWRGLLYAKRRQWEAMRRELGLGYQDVFTGKASSRRLLEMQYGWMPLMQSLKGGYDLLTEQVKDKALLVHGYGNHRMDYTFSGRSSDALGLRIRNRYQCGITANMSNDFSRTLTRAGLVNPLSLGWELVPYSFVIDWGIPIGNVLEGLSATMGLTFVDGWTAFTGQAFGHSIRDRRGLPGDVVTSNVESVHRYETYKRTRLLSFPLPGVYGKSPFSTSHSIAALALFRNLFK